MRTHYTHLVSLDLLPKEHIILIVVSLDGDEAAEL